MLRKRVGIDYGDMTDAESRQFFDDITSQTTAADHGYFTSEQGKLLPAGKAPLISLVARRKQIQLQDGLLNGWKSEPEILDRPRLDGKMDQSILSTGQKVFLETFHFTRPPPAERLPAGLPL